MSGLSQSAIQRVIPHRYPFLLVDRVTELVPGKRIVGIKNFTANQDALRGHFPCAPQVPAALLMEMVTQLSGSLILEGPGMEGKIAVILQIATARMLRPVQPGDSLRLEAQVVKLKETFGEMPGAAYCEGQLVADGHMRFAVADASGLSGDAKI